MDSRSTANPQNFLLAALDDVERKTLLKAARLIPLVFGETILEPDQTVDHVYFPETGVISIITEAVNGEAAEGGVTGSEGAAGLAEALGSGVMRSRGLVQADGSAWRVSSADCRMLYSTSMNFRGAAARASEFQAVEARQSLLCRSYHPVEQRLARWLLEMAERSNAQSMKVQITQEILSVMLAVQRTTVSSAARALRNAGLFSYARGKIVLLDIGGLEKTACACRGTIREAEAQILGRVRKWPLPITGAPA
jgi:CRP-like cAMP-binding protein